MKDDEATYWNREYIIQNNQVVDYLSLGMEKTEEESFNIQDIVELWLNRKLSFDTITTISNTDKSGKIK